MIVAEDIIGVQYYNIVRDAKNIVGEQLPYHGVCQLREYAMGWVTVLTPKGSMRIGNTGLEGIPITDEWLVNYPAINHRGFRKKL